jgi:hypothetical protein
VLGLKEVRHWLTNGPNTTVKISTQKVNHGWLIYVIRGLVKWVKSVIFVIHKPEGLARHAQVFLRRSLVI